MTDQQGSSHTKRGQKATDLINSPRVARRRLGVHTKAAKMVQSSAPNPALHFHLAKARKATAMMAKKIISVLIASVTALWSAMMRSFDDHKIEVKDDVGMLDGNLLLISISRQKKTDSVDTRHLLQISPNDKQSVKLEAECPATTR